MVEPRVLLERSNDSQRDADQQRKQRGDETSFCRSRDLFDQGTLDAAGPLRGIAWPQIASSRIDQVVEKLAIEQSPSKSERIRDALGAQRGHRGRVEPEWLVEAELR